MHCGIVDKHHCGASRSWSPRDVLLCSDQRADTMKPGETLVTPNPPLGSWVIRSPGGSSPEPRKSRRANAVRMLRMGSPEAEHASVRCLVVLGDRLGLRWWRVFGRGRAEAQRT